MSTPEPIRLVDYTAPPFWVDTVDLRVSIHADHTDVTAELAVRRADSRADADLVLDGRELELLGVAIDGRELDSSEYTRDDDSMTILAVGTEASLQIRTRIHPEQNTSLEGLYKADSAYCTQCEAQGFRKITYFPDRPDVMATYTTTIEADRSACPVMLSNGNAIERGNLDNGRHWVKWTDPFPKPSYLFALVAGDLACVADTYQTRSGRDVALEIFVEHHNVDKCSHAMTSLKNAMRWDEQVYGLEYDLDVYMIVAVDDFNMGAMENKGLNVFNSKYVLARPDTATDDDFAGIESVIAHEYFHNWTGNRVTCRDWFQLSLKEGLTVFRDQEFSADMGSRAVKRIQDVRVLRAAQFAEDAGPMAHPVRPAEYVEINNFYTVTIYNKGAELIRMMHTLIGADAFRRGMDLYFERHDGQAVTTDDFVQAMQDTSGYDLGQFRLWYAQAGTPEIGVEEHWDEATGELALTFSQQTPDTPGQSDKLPMPIPIRLGLVGGQPDSPAARGMHARRDANGDILAELRAERETLRLSGLNARPAASLLRGFSAPVKLTMEREATQLAHLFAHDTDPFNRWDASQSLVLGVVLDNVDNHQRGEEYELPDTLVRAFAATLTDNTLDPAFIAETLLLPGENYLADQMDVIDIDAVHMVSAWFRRALASALRQELLQTYTAMPSNEPYTPDGPSAGKRALRNAALGLLVGLDEAECRDLALAQFRDANNMTDSLAALRALAQHASRERDTVLTDFETRWSGESLVMDKWFGVQASSRAPDALARVRRLEQHPEFDLKKPNKVRALLGMFAHGNPHAFHAADGSGYEFVADRIAGLDTLNPQVAARLVTAFARWSRITGPRQAMMRDALVRIQLHAGLSRDVGEMVSRTLGDA